MKVREPHACIYSIAFRGLPGFISTPHTSKPVHLRRRDHADNSCLTHRALSAGREAHRNLSERDRHHRDQTRLAGWDVMTGEEIKSREEAQRGECKGGEEETWEKKRLREEKRGKKSN